MSCCIKISQSLQNHYPVFVFVSLMALFFCSSDYDSLNEEDAGKNTQLAFDTAEKEFGVKPFTTAKELVSGQEPDKNSMMTYLSKFYELFRGTPLPSSGRHFIRCTLHVLSSRLVTNNAAG